MHSYPHIYVDKTINGKCLHFERKQGTRRIYERVRKKGRERENIIFYYNLKI